MDPRFGPKEIGRFQSFVEKDSHTGCCNWGGPKIKKGYGKFWLAGKTVRAHRAAYEMHAGEPIGLLLTLTKAA